METSVLIKIQYLSIQRFELDSEMKGACGVYAKWLEDSTQVNTRELVSHSGSFEKYLNPKYSILVI